MNAGLCASFIRRPSAQTACALEVDTDSYSLWGGSAGARMAAYLGSCGHGGGKGKELPED